MTNRLVMDKTYTTRRFIAEWEPVEAVLIALPFEATDWNYILSEAILQYKKLIEALLSTGIYVVVLCRDRDEARLALGRQIADNERICLSEIDFNDTWIRDYGPIHIENHGELRCLDFGFNAWGLKFPADKDNLVNLGLSERNVLIRSAYRNHRDFVLEGGSIESDGTGTVMTTSRCLLSPNRNGGKTKHEINEILYEKLGATHVLWLDYGALEGDDTDSHIDTLARLAPDDTIIFTGCRDIDDPQFESLLKMRAQLELFRTAEGKAFNLVELPLPSPVFDPVDGSRLPATYANYLIVNEHILMPTYGDPLNDRLAVNTMRIAFPEHRVIEVDCRTLLRQHGSLHCATMQLPVGALNQNIFEL